MDITQAGTIEAIKFKIGEYFSFRFVNRLYVSNTFVLDQETVFVMVEVMFGRQKSYTDDWQARYSYGLDARPSINILIMSRHTRWTTVYQIEYFIWIFWLADLSSIMIGLNEDTSNGSWCIGIKGEMSGTVCVTFTWDIYIYMSCL